MTLGYNIAENLQLKSKKDTILKKISLQKIMCVFEQKRGLFNLLSQVARLPLLNKIAYPDHSRS